MSEINRGVPESVQQNAKIIDFEAARGKRLEEKTRHAQWIQERTQKQPFTDGEAAPSASFQFTTEADQPPQKGRQVAFTANEGKAGENRPSAENTHLVIDFQKAREKRLLNEQSDTFTPPDFKPRPNEAGENVVNEREDDEQIALAQIRTKLARLEVPSEKRDGIIDGLADDPNAATKVAGVLRHITPPDIKRQVEQEIAESTAFHYRFQEAIEKKLASLQQESQDGSIMELLISLFKEFMTGKNDENQDTQDAEAVNG
jgi:hypothetical protein